MIFIPTWNSVQKAFFYAFFVLALSGCVSRKPSEIYDPLESVNRKIFAFNRAADEKILEPVARGYRKITPKLFRIGIGNAVKNLSEPINILNSALQLNVKRTGDSLYRFGVNSIWGVFGLIDVASMEGVPVRKEDFGQTLALYGVPQGPYLMLPVLGPMTLRQVGGRIFDSVAFSTLNTSLKGDVSYIFWSRPAISILTQRERSIETIEKLRRSAIDEYALVRNAYYNIREYKISNQDENLESIGSLPSPSKEKDLEDLDDFE